MCDSDGDPPSCSKITFRTARKHHECYACEGTIRPRDRYRHLSGVWGGYPQSFAHCLRCAAILAALPDDAELNLDCGEVWKDPPPEIEALAFWLPGDELPAAQGIR